MAWRKPANLREWTHILYRHRIKALFPALLAAILAVVVSYKIPREYRADAKFERKSDPTMRTAGSNTAENALWNIRQKINEDIKGVTSVEQLVEDLGLTRDLPHTNDGALTVAGQQAKLDLVKKFQERIGISWQIRSDSLEHITITFTDSSRELPPRVVNRIVDNYMDETRRELSDMLTNSQAFFQREMERYKGIVQDLENKKLTFMRDNPGLNPDDPNSLNARQTEITSTLTRVTAEIEETKSVIAKNEEYIRGQPEKIMNRRQGENPKLTDLNSRISTLNRDIDDMKRANMTEEHPKLKSARKQLAVLEEQAKTMQAMVEVGVDEMVNEQRATAIRENETRIGRIAALERQKAELINQLDAINAQQKNFIILRNELVSIERRLAEANEQLNFWDDKYKKTSMAVAFEISQKGVRMTWLNRAPDIGKPSRPTFIQIAAMAGAAFLGVAAIIIILAELLDHSFRTPDQAVEELKLPLLGAVSEIVTPGLAMRRRFVNWGVLPVATVALTLTFVVLLGVTYISLDNPQRFDQLRARPVETVKDMLRGRG